jgi:DHA2 family multidrug resistance protein
MLMFLLGFGLYGSFTMLPLFVQKVLGYTATWAGLVLSPGAVMSLLCMGMVAFLVGRIDTRFLILFGASMNVVALWLLQHVYLDVDFWYVTTGRIVQGLGLAFLFVPLTTAAFINLRPEQMGQATGLFNLLRNEGGSVGIAISATILSQHSQLHHARLAEHLTAGNAALQESLGRMSQWLDGATGFDQVTNQALAWQILDGEVQRQAVVMAYDDVFWIQTVAFAAFLPLFAAFLPLIFFLGSKARRGEAAVH